MIRKKLICSQRFFQKRKLYEKHPDPTGQIAERKGFHGKMQQENLIVPYGSSWGDESLPAFATKQCAICTGSIAAFNRVEKAMADDYDALMIPGGD